MANLRIVADNAADRATITASTTAGTLTTANLKDDTKGLVWRATGVVASLTLTWSAAEPIYMASLVFANLTSTATMRLRGYTNTGDASPIFDTGVVACCPYVPLGGWEWGAVPLGVNAFPFGGASTGTVWVPNPAAVRKLVIDIDNTGNAAGYVEVSRVVCGPYWSPAVNAAFGASLGMADDSKHERTDAGDLRTNAAARHKKVAFDLAYLSAADRQRAWDIAAVNGMVRPLFVSLSPESGDDPGLEQASQVYGKLSQASAIAYQAAGLFATKLEIEEV